MKKLILLLAIAFSMNAAHAQWSIRTLGNNVLVQKNSDTLTFTGFAGVLFKSVDNTYLNIIDGNKQYVNIAYTDIDYPVSSDLNNLIGILSQSTSTTSVTIAAASPETQSNSVDVSTITTADTTTFTSLSDGAWSLEVHWVGVAGAGGSVDLFYSNTDSTFSQVSHTDIPILLSTTTGTKIIYSGSWSPKYLTAIITKGSMTAGDVYLTFNKNN